jgi:hypothetical protein
MEPGTEQEIFSLENWYRHFLSTDAVRAEPNSTWKKPNGITTIYPQKCPT